MNTLCTSKPSPTLLRQAKHECAHAWIVAVGVAHLVTAMARIPLAFVSIASDIKADVELRYQKSLRAVQSEARDAFFDKIKVSLDGTTRDAHAMLKSKWGSLPEH